MTALLADAEFRRIWLIGAIAGGLRWLELLAVGVYVLEQTGSPSMVAFITALRLAPMFVCGSLIGALGDRYERKHVLLIGLAIVGATSMLLGALAFADQITLWQIALGAVVSGGLVAADMALRRIMSAEIAGAERLGSAMALEAINNNATRMLGPALGGLLLELLGLYGVYLLGALLYLVGIVLLLRVRHRPERSEGDRQDVLSSLRGGWRYVRARRVIFGVLAVTLVANFWGFAYITMVPVIGERVLGLPAFPIGVLLSIQGFGAVLGALLFAQRSRTTTYTRIFFASTLAMLLAVLGFGLSAWYPLSLLLNLLCGVGAGGFSVMQNSILILAARPELRSRVMGVLAVCIGAGQLGGMMHVGLLADWLGAAAAVQLMAAEGLMALALTAMLWPEMRRATDVAPGSAEAAELRSDSAILYRRVPRFAGRPVERWRLFFARQISETVVMTSSAEPPGKPWYKRFLRFDRKRWWAFGLILGLIYFLALFGVWLTIFIPFLGTPLFITRLMIWYIPGILFSWTGLFAFHEFGASPTGWLGHLVMFGFYACVAAIASWRFGLTRKRR